MKRRDFLASSAAATVLPAAGMAAEPDLQAGLTHIRVTAEINHEGCLVVTVGYPDATISTSYSTPVNQEQPHQTQMVFRPKNPVALSKLSQVKEHGGAKSFWWLFSRSTG